MTKRELDIHQTYEQIPQQRLVQEWRQYPLQAMSQTLGGIEIFENMTERGHSLEELYIEIRERVIENQITTVAAISEAAVSKGTFLASIMAMLKNDEYLKATLKEKIVFVIPHFALYAMAAKLLQVRRDYPWFAVPRKYHHGGFKPEHYARISAFMWIEIRECILDNMGINPLAHHVILFESAGPSAYPLTTEVPIAVMGTDRGNSVLYNLALHPKTRDNFVLAVIKRDPRVTGFTKDWRAKVNSSDAIPDYLFTGNLKICFTHPKKGQIYVDTLSEKDKIKFARFLRKCMATPRAIERVDEDLRKSMENLKAEGKIKNCDIEEYQKYIASALGVQPHIITNIFLETDKTYNLDYFLDSLPVRRFPELVRGIARIIR